MGNKRTTLLNVPHVWIQKPSACGEIFVGPVKFQDLPSPNEVMAKVDSMLWQRFSSELDQHVPKLNVGLRRIWILFFIFIAMIIFVSHRLKHLLPFTSLIIWLPMIPLYVKYYSFIKQNQIIDSDIKKVCDTYNHHFMRKGYRIEYKTEWTNFCKPKHAKPSRVLIFHSYVDIEESKLNDAEDCFDRKSWGLEL